MKDEIKELFPKEFYIKKDKKMYAEISLENLNKIADCITNLQEENRQTKLLKERYQLEKEDYKSRNEKAIKYIKENICDIDFMKKEYGNHFIDYAIETTFKDIENLINILGDDNE